MSLYRPPYSVSLNLPLLISLSPTSNARHYPRLLPNSHLSPSLLYLVSVPLFLRPIPWAQPPGHAQGIPCESMREEKRRKKNWREEKGGRSEDKVDERSGEEWGGEGGRPGLPWVVNKIQISSHYPARTWVGVFRGGGGSRSRVDSCNLHGQPLGLLISLLCYYYYFFYRIIGLCFSRDTVKFVCIYIYIFLRYLMTIRDTELRCRVILCSSNFSF